MKSAVAPPPVDSLKYRPRKITNSFVTNIVGLVVWKEMCGKDNLCWPRDTNLQSGSTNMEVMKKKLIELRKRHRDKLEQISSLIDIKMIPALDPEKLVTFGQNLKRKHKHGIWATPEEYEALDNKGLFVGHHRILTKLGYSFPEYKDK